MPAKIMTCALRGIGCELVEVEVDILGSLNPSLSIVGLADTAIHESKERIRAACKNSGLEFPRKRKVVNLAPADLKKQGPMYDLPIAIGILAAAANLHHAHLQDTIWAGELSLDGTLKAVNGIIAMTAFARAKKFKRIVLPSANAHEASLIDGIEIIAVSTLLEAFEFLQNPLSVKPFSPKILPAADHHQPPVNLHDIIGQKAAKRAMEISAAGGHNLLFNGPPGSGKTMLGRAMAGILPDLDMSETLEISKIYSVAGLLKAEIPLIRERPYRAIHHSATIASIIGGGRVALPGEISLAHHGILFLDEFAEFPSYILDHLRQPLEDHTITLARSSGTVTYPANFILVAAMNPCPCGFYTDLQRKCICTDYEISRYRKKISGPLLDRIDLFIEVPRINIAAEKNSKKDISESSQNIKTKIEQARKIQKNRFKNWPIGTNSQMNGRQIAKFCPLDAESETILTKAADKLHMSARSYYRVIKVARTISDLEQEENIAPRHILEALQYRESTL